MKSTPSLRTALNHNRRGATMVEYAIMLALILVIAAVVWNKVGYRVGAAGTDANAAFSQ